MDEHAAGLPDAVRPVGGLVLHGGVPPPVEVDDVVRPGQVQPGAAGPQRDQHERRAVLGLEVGHHRVAAGSRHPAVQPQGLGRRTGARGTARACSPQVAYWVNASARSPLSRISSSSSSIRVSFPLRPGSADPSPSSRAGWLQTCLSLVRPASTAPRRSMPSFSSASRAGRRPPPGRAPPARGSAGTGRSARPWPAGPGAMSGSDFSRRRMNGRVMPLQPPGRLLVAVPLDRDGEALPELPGRAQQAGREDVHDRPQLREPVLHRRPGQRHPSTGRAAAAPPAPAAVPGFFTCWASSRTSRPQAISARLSMSRWTASRS